MADDELENKCLVLEELIELSEGIEKLELDSDGFPPEEVTLPCVLREDRDSDVSDDLDDRDDRDDRDDVDRWIMLLDESDVDRDDRDRDGDDEDGS